MTIEMNFDGLVGPTHNYAGLSLGNVASERNEGLVSHPRGAAQQGLAKMKALADLGVPQGILPPHERPHIPTLRQLGFSGSDAAILDTVKRTEPLLLRLVSSASSMWAANAATVTPSADSADGRVHFTPASLVTTFHRSLEPATTTRVLRRVFSDPDRFVVHEPLPSSPHLADEGAANHTRLVVDGRGVHVFVYGRSAFDGGLAPERYPARQTLEACRAIARRHGLSDVVYLQQHPSAIDRGVFHNDVISVGHENVFLCHEEAFAAGSAAIATLRQHTGDALFVVVVRAEEATVDDVVRSYLFNSQLVTTSAGTMVLVAPTEARHDPRSAAVIERIVAEDTPIDRAVFVDVRESMQNGGGPACLRLRVALSTAEQTAVRGGCVFDDARHAALSDWVDRRYREDLRPSDLGDPSLVVETREALDELTQLLDLGSIYDFQQP
jgi:succinylarginine dihydrolase